MTRIVAHLGYIKSASSSLQNNLFAAHPQLNYLATQLKDGALRTAFQSSPRTTRFYRALQSREPAEDLQDLWNGHVAPALDPQRTNVLSEETVLTMGDPQTVLTRLARVAPTAHVLMIMRDQADLLRSLYDMFPTIRADGAGVGTHAGFDAWLDHILDRDGHFGLAGHLHYARTIRMAQATFGPDQVCAISFAQLFGSPAAQDRLATCIGVPLADVQAALHRPAVNDHRDHAAKKLTRRLMGPVHASWIVPQPILKRINTALGRVVRSGPTRMTDAQRERIMSFYAADTAELQAVMTGAAAQAVVQRPDGRP